MCFIVYTHWHFVTLTVFVIFFNKTSPQDIQARVELEQQKEEYILKYTNIFYNCWISMVEDQIVLI